jgi:hypothetical protein
MIKPDLCNKRKMLNYIIKTNKRKINKRKTEGSGKNA